MSSQIKTHYLTKEGYDKLLEELHYLKNEKLPAELERLKEAIEQGDISENAEYDSAMTEKDLIQGRIMEIEDIMQNVEIIEHSPSGGEVRYGSIVTFVDDKDRKSTMTIVGSSEANILVNTISFESPLGSAMRGKQKGNKVRIKAPNRKYQVEILNVE